MSQQPETVEQHFGALQTWHWTDVADAARDMWRQVFNEDLREDGLVMALIDGACARSYYGVIEVVAAAIGARPGDLNKAVAQWGQSSIQRTKPSKEGE